MTIRVLELFKGSGSVGKYCSKFQDKYEVVSLDIDEGFNADITNNILDWDYKSQFPSGYFQIIWASPPCTEYSCLLYALKNRVRDLEGADKIVKKTLEVIDYFKPNFWFIENPKTGLLKSRDIMRDLPYYDVSYCKYGYTYRKHTRIWTNLRNFAPLVCKKDCGMMKGNNHINNIGHGNSKAKSIKDLTQRYSIPQPLIHALFVCCVFDTQNGNEYD
jgi:site-specific DNA-cytosine methylase